MDFLLIDQSCNERLFKKIRISCSESPFEAILATADDFRKAGVANVIMDFVNAAWISGEVLGMLCALFSRARESKGKVVLANLGPRLLNIMVITKLDQVIPNVGSLENAAEYLLSRDDGVGTSP